MFRFSHVVLNFRVLGRVSHPARTTSGSGFRNIAASDLRRRGEYSIGHVDLAIFGT